MTRIIGPYPTEGEARFAAISVMTTLPLDYYGIGTSRSYDVFPVYLHSIVNVDNFQAAVPVVDWYAVIYSTPGCFQQITEQQ